MCDFYMRRLLLLTLLIPVFSYAGKVTEQQALLKAQQFLEGKSFRLPEKARKIKSLGQSCDSMGFYVFNVEENGGFVIVSGDDRTKDILGYAESGHLDLNNLPDHISWWLNTYTKAISSLSNNNSVQQTIKKESKAEILPLIKTQWAQDSPYSDQCIINGTQCATGCAATAMAQVMNYWKWPTSVEAMNGYTVGSQTVDALPKTLFNWKDMTDADKAKLCRYCGQSINMEYGALESAASSVIIPVALVKTFGYDAGTHTVYREGYPPADWEGLIYRELYASRPVIYCGSSPTNYAHAFICDGYKDGLYHINWGWGGLHDTYFVLTVLDAYGENNLSHTFSENQFAIIGIQKPNGGSTEGYPPLTMTKMEVQSNLTVTRESIVYTFKGVVLNWELSNSLIDDMNAQIIIALYHGDELIRKIVTHPLTTINPGLYLNQMIAINFGTRVSDGTYQLKIVYADENGTIHFPQGHDYRYVKAVIRDNTMTLKNYPRPDGEDDPEEPISYAYGEQFDWKTNEGIITLEVTSTSPKTVKIVKGSTSLSGDVNIPESIKDYQVTEISDFAFAE